jgi:hypothetical protein
VELIKVEDDGIDDASPNASPIDRGIIADSKGKDQAGLFGFFKKTFSSVKKTFEKTFNQKDLKSKSHTRPPSTNEKRGGTITPVAQDLFSSNRD